MGAPREGAPSMSGRPQVAPTGLAVDTRAGAVARHGPVVPGRAARQGCRALQAV